MFNWDLLKSVDALLEKQGFVPSSAVPSDPMMAMQAGMMPPMGGMMPPDPGMMGGMAPPMNPGMMGGMPPMDTAPPMMPPGGGGMVDPAMMGMDSAMMAPPPTEAPPTDEAAKEEATTVAKLEVKLEAMEKRMDDLMEMIKSLSSQKNMANDQVISDLKNLGA